MTTVIPFDFCLDCVKKFGIIVGASTVEGQGVFAFGEFKKGNKIVEYFGEIISKKEEMKRYKKDEVAPYATRLHNGLLIDSALERGVGSIVNHGETPNCELVCEHDKIWLYSLRDLEFGEELLINYGYDDFSGNHWTVVVN